MESPPEDHDATQGWAGGATDANFPSSSNPAGNEHSRGRSSISRGSRNPMQRGRISIRARNLSNMPAARGISRASRNIGTPPSRNSPRARALTHASSSDSRLPMVQGVHHPDSGSAEDVHMEDTYSFTPIPWASRSGPTTASDATFSTRTEIRRSSRTPSPASRITSSPMDVHMASPRRRKPPFSGVGIASSPGDEGDLQDARQSAPSDTTAASLAAEAHNSDSLGLYDDPADLHEVIRGIQELDIEAEQIDSSDISNPRQPALSPIREPPASVSQVMMPSRRPREAYHSSHSMWYARLLMAIVTFLHTRHHVSFRACAMVLTCLNILFIALALLDRQEPLPVTLSTVLDRFDLTDRFDTLPTCHLCHALSPVDSPGSSTCASCSAELFKPVTRPLFERLTGRNASGQKPTPLLATPVRPLSSSLVDFLARPGIEKRLEDWRSRPPPKDGEYRDMPDGAVWNTIKAHDGQRFFEKSGKTLEEQSELRIGVTMSLDWFGRNTSAYGPSHSSGALSFCVSNLPPELRYSVRNLIIGCMTPGPKEPTAEQLQQYLRVFVDDLLYLYEHGIRISTPDYPEGRLVRVVLLAIVCDHPAMCKMCGFADHAHKNFPCTKCKVPADELYSDKSLAGGYEPRTSEEHRRQAYEWLALEDPSDRAKFFELHGTRWTEFARLPYFDLVRCVIIDPMHNLMLGVVRTQWFSQWIKGTVALRASTDKRTRELDVLHRFLDSFESPLWAGQLPARVGEPAGGSLSADEYKSFVTMLLPLIIPTIWDVFLEEANRDFERAQIRYKRDYEKYEKDSAIWKKDELERELADRRLAISSISSSRGVQKRYKKGATKKAMPVKKAPQPPEKPRPRMQPEEPVHFLRLATAMKIMVGRTIDDASISRAALLFQDFLFGFKELYGSRAMKPNFHWSVHAPDQFHDFGPIANFWNFLGERLNKILKNFNSNGWIGGQLEISMMRAFMRDVQFETLLSDVLSSTASNSSLPDDITNKVMTVLMSTQSGESVGTVQDLSSSSAALYGGTRVEAGPLVTSQDSSLLSDPARAALYHRYNSPNKPQRVQYPPELHAASEDLPILNANARFFQYAMHDGRRITPLSHNLRQNAGSSIVKVDWNGNMHAGEVLTIFQHFQQGVQDTLLFAEMRWMKHLPDYCPVDSDPWADFPELEVECWEYDTYHEHNSDSSVPPAVIEFSLIHCQLARGMIQSHDIPRLWITTSMERHSTAYSVLYSEDGI